MTYINVKTEIDNSKKLNLIDIEFIDELIGSTEDILKSLFGEANDIAQNFWQAHDIKRTTNKKSNYSFLTLRVKPTISSEKWIGSFSIIWSNSKCVKENGQWVQRSEQIKRGKKSSYSMRSFKKSHAWEYEYVTELEPIFAQIRIASLAVSKARMSLIHAKKCIISAKKSTNQI